MTSAPASGGAFLWPNSPSPPADRRGVAPTPGAARWAAPDRCASRSAARHHRRPSREEHPDVSLPPHPIACAPRRKRSGDLRRHRRRRRSRWWRLRLLRLTAGNTLPAIVPLPDAGPGIFNPAASTATSAGPAPPADRPGSRSAAAAPPPMYQVAFAGRRSRRHGHQRRPASATCNSSTR